MRFYLFSTLYWVFKFLLLLVTFTLKLFLRFHFLSSCFRFSVSIPSNCSRALVTCKRRATYFELRNAWTNLNYIQIWLLKSYLLANRHLESNAHPNTKRPYFSFFLIANLYLFDRHQNVDCVDSNINLRLAKRKFAIK